MPEIRPRFPVSFPYDDCLAIGRPFSHPDVARPIDRSSGWSPFFPFIHPTTPKYLFPSFGSFFYFWSMSGDCFRTYAFPSFTYSPLLTESVARLPSPVSAPFFLPPTASQPCSPHQVQSGSSQKSLCLAYRLRCQYSGLTYR